MKKCCEEAVKESREKRDAFLKGLDEQRKYLEESHRHSVAWEEGRKVGKKAFSRVYHNPYVWSLDPLARSWHSGFLWGRRFKDGIFNFWGLI